LMHVNQAQNGGPFVFGYSKYPMTVKFGFGVEGHTPLKGLWNVTCSIMRTTFWVVPFIGLFSLISLFKKDLKLTLLFVPAIAFPIFYLFINGVDFLGMGARFYYLPFLIMLIPCAAGIRWLDGERFAEFTKGKGETKAFGAIDGLVSPALLVSFLIYIAVGVYPALLPRVSGYFKEKGGFLKWLENPPKNPPPTLIFLRDHYGKKNFVYTRNPINYKDQERIYVLYLTPEENKKLIKELPNHTPLMTKVEFVEGNEKFVLVPVDLTENAENYLWAGLNYQHGAFNLKKAEKAYLHGLEIDPEDGQLMIELASAYKEEKLYKKAIELYNQMSKQKKLNAISALLAASTLAEMGERQKARSILEDIMNQLPGSTVAARAKKLLEGQIDLAQ
jgi:hypothetical protein